MCGCQYRLISGTAADMNTVLGMCTSLNVNRNMRAFVIFSSTSVLIADVNTDVYTAEISCVGSSAALDFGEVAGFGASLDATAGMSRVICIKAIVYGRKNVKGIQRAVLIVFLIVRVIVGLSMGEDVCVSVDVSESRSVAVSLAGHHFFLPLHFRGISFRSFVQTLLTKSMFFACNLSGERKVFSLKKLSLSHYSDFFGTASDLTFWVLTLHSM